ncbi:MAG TPA: RNA methyltransferase [Chitinophagaceae bacterium]
MRKRSMDELNRKSAEAFREADKIPVMVVLENIRSAYNVGSIFRTADAFLLQGIHICGYTARPPHKEIKKTALGSDEVVTWSHFANAGESITKLKAEGYKVFAVEQTEGSVALQLVNRRRHEKTALVFGNEVTGVEQSTILLCDGSIEIPQMGTKHSLNVSVAAGIVLWEMIREHIPVL